jgi:hypothetical protein
MSAWETKENHETLDRYGRSWLIFEPGTSQKWSIIGNRYSATFDRKLSYLVNTFTLVPAYTRGQFIAESLLSGENGLEELSEIGKYGSEGVVVL